MGLLGDKWLIPVGCTCLAIAILADRFITGNSLVDFMVGILTGMSIVMNLTALYRSRRPQVTRGLPSASTRLASGLVDCT